MYIYILGATHKLTIAPNESQRERGPIDASSDQTRGAADIYVCIYRYIYIYIYIICLLHSPAGGSFR